MNKLYKKAGFTLIELIVVMVIISVLMGLGVEGLIRFKASVEVQESGRQMITLLEQIKNAAKNDVRSGSSTNNRELGYRYDFNGSSNQYLRVCQLSSNTSIQSKWDNCNWQVSGSDDLFNVAEIPIHIGVSPGSKQVSSIPECNYIYIEFLTGDILVDTEWGPGSQEHVKCYVPFTDNNNRYTYYLFINGIIDSFDIYVTPEDIDDQRPYNKI